jgi:hypothetical protein
MAIQWPDLRFPPVNLWSLPHTASDSRARTESLVDGLIRSGYEARWFIDPEGRRSMLEIRRLKDPHSRYEAITPSEAVNLIEYEASKTH